MKMITRFLIGMMIGVCLVSFPFMFVIGLYQLGLQLSETMSWVLFVSVAVGQLLIIWRVVMILRRRGDGL